MHISFISVTYNSSYTRAYRQPPFRWWWKESENQTTYHQHSKEKPNHERLANFHEAHTYSFFIYFIQQQQLIFAIHCWCRLSAILQCHWAADFPNLRFVGPCTNIQDTLKDGDYSV